MIALLHLEYAVCKEPKLVDFDFDFDFAVVALPCPNSGKRERKREIELLNLKSEIEG